MATTRGVGTCTMSSTSCTLKGALLSVPFSGGACPSVLGPIRFDWTKDVSALTSGEQSDVVAAVAMLQAKVNAEEACTDLRSVRWFQLTLGAGGTVQNVTAWLDGPTVGGKVRQLWARWSKQRSAFSGGEQGDLDAVVAMLDAYLTAEEPLP